MLVVETVAKVRRAHLVGGKEIDTIARELGLARDTVRRAVRSGETSCVYERRMDQPRPRLGDHRDRLEATLAGNAAWAKRERLTPTLTPTRIHSPAGSRGMRSVLQRGQTLCAAVDAGAAGLSSGGRGIRAAELRARRRVSIRRSHEGVEIAGAPQAVKVAHLRLCPRIKSGAGSAARFYIRAYPRETQDMVFDAHARAFAALGGVPRRGTYDNMKAAVRRDLQPTPRASAWGRASSSPSRACLIPSSPCRRRRHRRSASPP